MNIQNSLKLISIIIFTLFSIFLFGAHSVSALDCNAFKDQQGSRGRITGAPCGRPGQYMGAQCFKKCGYTHIVTYCNDGGCEEEWSSDQKEDAPAECSRPCSPDKPSEIGKFFGQVDTPLSIARFGFGALGISKFLSNGVVLILSLAIIALLLMLIWGAYEWTTSGGDKEKLSSAQKKIINAIIGIILLAITFAVIQVLGQFTGIKFFPEQYPKNKSYCPPGKENECPG